MMAYVQHSPLTLGKKRYMRKKMEINQLKIHLKEEKQ